MLKRILLVVLLIMVSAVIATAQTAALKNYYNQENTKWVLNIRPIGQRERQSGL